LDRTLLSVAELPKVKAFLKSKSRNSVRTKNIYSFALAHFETFLKYSDYKNYDAETILIPIIKKDIDLYILLDNFVEHLSNKRLTAPSIRTFVSGIRSYFEHYDVEISVRKFKNRVTLPKRHKVQAEAIDAEDIRTMLINCTNARLKCFILLLSTTGLRANEALSLTNSDIHFDNDSLTKIHIRAEITKTKTERNIYTTQECSKELRNFLDSKYSRKHEWSKYPNHNIFKLQKVDEESKGKLYARLSFHFTRLLDKIGMNQRKDGQHNRRKISFHSFRRFVKSTISDIDSDYSEYYIGHSGSSYWTKKEPIKQEKYKQCEKYLTFLDYHTLQTTSKDLESQVQQSNKMIEDMQDRIWEAEFNETHNVEAIKQMNKEIEDLKKKISKLEPK
jgi:integrase